MITIDGPAGAGKSTISRMTAKRLGSKYVDTGALYRAVALQAIRTGVTDKNSELALLCRNLNLKILWKEDYMLLLLDGLELGNCLRTQEVSMRASAVAAIPAVREYLLKFQRTLGLAKGMVFEGRDMGTVVFPDADLKIYLDADPAVRAARRYKESVATSLEQITAAMKRRDQNDGQRELAPLKPAKDALIIDSTDLSTRQVVDKIMEQF